MNEVALHLCQKTEKAEPKIDLYWGIPEGVNWGTCADPGVPAAEGAWIGAVQRGPNPGFGLHRHRHIYASSGFRRIECKDFVDNPSHS